VRIGRDCNIWQGVLIKNGVSICDNVTIGMGSLVTRSIISPGIYYGSPCRKKENK
jgi:acetyltransferase-like isoleucine patch superfamily enzyme